MKDNFTAAKGVIFSEEEQTGKDKVEMVLLSKGEVFEDMKSEHTFRMTRSKLLNIQSKELSVSGQHEKSKF